MELFDLVSKLTLDAKEYEHALTEAESKGAGLDDIEAQLDLDTSPFEEAVQEAEDTDVSDPEAPELDLDSDKFYKEVEEAEREDIADPQEPELDLDTDKFYSEVEAAESEVVNDPETPSLDLDHSGFDTEIVNVKSISDTFSVDIMKVFDGIKEHVSTAITGLGLVSLVNNLSDAVDLARSMGDNIDKSSRAMSISATAYQEWSHMLDINGASITDLNRGLMSMRKLMGGGEVTKDAAAAFESLGLSAKVANGEITNTEDLMMATLKALADFEGDTAERDVLAQAIFGRGGTKLNTLFDGTSEDMDALIQQAHELGLVLTDEEVANAASYNDAVTNMNASLDALKTSLVSEILPILTDVFNQAAKIFALFNWRTGDKGLEETFKDIDENGAEALITLNENKTEAMALIDKLAEMGDYWTLDDNGKKTFDQLAAELIKLYPDLDKVISDNKNAIGENTEAIKANIDEWTKLEQQRILSQNLADKRTAIAEQYAAALDKEIEADVKEAEAEGKKTTAIEAVNEILKKNEDLRNAVQGRWGTTTLNEENAADILKWIQDQSFLTTGMDSVEEFNKLNAEAQTLREEASKMEEEADAASQSYTEYADALAKKLGIAISDTQTATSEAKAFKDALDDIPSQVRVNLYTTGPVAVPKAKGDWNVPYDDYPALLHRGERVLTASQARQMDSGSGGSVDFSGMYDIVERAIRSGMSGVSVNSFLSGKDVTDDVNRNTGRQLKARRFRG